MTGSSSSAWLLCQHGRLHSVVHPKIPPSEQAAEQTRDLLGPLVALKMMFDIFIPPINLFYFYRVGPPQVPPKKPASGSRLPRKGLLVEEPTTVHTFGTVRP